MSVDRAVMTLDARRWVAGQELLVGGLRWRVCRGTKAPGDLRLDVLVSGVWHAVPMAVGAMLADFFYENEEVLYPPPFKGGGKYLQYIRDSARHGWVNADYRLQEERFARTSPLFPLT